MENLVFVTEGKADRLHLNCAVPGDVVFTQRGTLGQVGMIPFGTPYSRFLISQSQMKISVDPQKADSIFLYFYFRLPSIVSYVENHALQSGVPHINLGILKQFDIHLPPLPIQRKIAAILSAYDDLIENNNRRISILEKMAEELYREWFVRLRFPGHGKVKIVKGVPEGWTVKRIGDLVVATMGQSPSSEFYNQNGIGLPFNQGVGTYGSRFPKKEVYCDTKGRIAEQGDILISVRAPVGRLNIADCKMIIGRGLASLRHKNGLNSYLYYLLKQIFSSEDIIGNGAIFNSVTKDELLGSKLLAPSDSLDELFNNNIKPIDGLIASLINKTELLTNSRDRLLTRLMSGKIDVAELDIQFPPGMKETEGVPDA